MYLLHGKVMKNPNILRLQESCTTGSFAQKNTNEAVYYFRFSFSGVQFI
jgi:hypothetical protein